MLFYTPERFENFILRLDFLLPHPRGANNDNSGVFVRFRDPRLPDPAPDPVDPANNTAFVAVNTGYEVQIDEEARGDKRFGEPDGSFFSRKARPSGPRICRVIAVNTRSWMHALVSAMRDHIDQPKARQAQQADKDQGNGVYDHTMLIIILAFRVFVFREVGNR